jgi:tetratricopeptide (TPR) repeat protein
VALAPDDPSVLVNAGFALGHLRGDHVDASIRWLDRAITLNANSSAAFGLGAIIRNFVGDYATSARHAHHAMRLSPFDPLTWVFDLALGVSHFFRRELGDAIRHLRKSSQDNPGHPATFFFLACALAHSGRIDEARAAMARMLELRPVTTVAWQRRRGTHFPVEDFEYALEGARLAGLPE